ncbi:NDR1/HIN1 protein [Trifolium repens]|nr:NDR1/HIN1 protein [Trifolium repens]
MATSTNEKTNNATNPPPSGGASNSYPFYQQPAAILTCQQPPSVARSFLFGFIFVITVIVTILFIAVTISYFILKPCFPEFRVNSATLTSFTFNNSDLTAKWDISLIVSNPNKKLEITYNAIAASIYYENELELLASTQLPPFNQPKQSNNVIGVQFEILNEFIDNSVSDGIADGRIHGFVQFGMVLNVMIKLNGLFHPNEFLLKVSCEPLNFGMSNNINNVTWVLLGGLDCSI